MIVLLQEEDHHGITASIYLKRANINCLVIKKDEGSLQKADKIENYYGFTKPIKGDALIQNGIDQAKRIGVKVVEDEVLSIDFEDTYLVKAKKENYKAKAILIATGLPRNTPRIEGIKEYEGKGISYCAICDGFFYKGKNVAVFGQGNYALHEAQELLPIVNSVTILTNGQKVEENRSSNIKVNEKEVRSFQGEEKLKSVEFEDDSRLEVDGIFIADGVASSVDLARRLGILIKGNTIIVNENMETNIKGIYASGDCTGGLLQISKATYEGAKAALSISKYIRGKKQEV